MKTTQTQASKALIAVARAAHEACDNCDERGPFALIYRKDYNRLCRALDRLDALPELPSPVIGSGAAKAEAVISNHERKEQP